MSAAVKPRSPGPAPGSTAPYEAARSARRLYTWQPSRAHINAILALHGDKLRDRTRDLLRNNGDVRQAVDHFIAHLVGTGIVPNPNPGDAALKRPMRRLFLDWTDFSDADGNCDAYGQQALVVRSYLAAGEVFARRRPRRPEDGLPVPLQVQLIDAAQLPLGDNRVLPNGQVVRSGIQFDAIGRRVGYHFLKRHPGDDADPSFADRTATAFVPSSEIIHLFEVLEPGQIRGEPKLVAALVRAFLLDQYDDAEIERKRVAAMFAGFSVALAQTQVTQHPTRTLPNLPRAAIGIGEAMTLPPKVLAGLASADS